MLWVVPGSQCRLNTAQENRELLEDRRAPHSNGMQVKLKAGDGVMYMSTILHWPSNYSTKLRRVILLGYRSFGAPLLPYVQRFYWELSFFEHLSAEAQAAFERFTALAEREDDRIESFFRAILDRDADGLREYLALLHRGETGRMVCVVLLSKLAAKIDTLKRPEVAGLPERERAATVGEQTFSIRKLDVLADRFTNAETDRLAQRFAPLDGKLHTETEQFVPGFQSGPSRHRFEHMPPEFEVDDFIVSWKRTA